MRLAPIRVEKRFPMRCVPSCGTPAVGVEHPCTPPPTHTYDSGIDDTSSVGDEYVIVYMCVYMYIYICLFTSCVCVKICIYPTSTWCILNRDAANCDTGGVGNEFVLYKYIYLYIHTYIYIYIYMYIYIYAYICMPMNICVCACSCVYINIYTHKYLINMTYTYRDAANGDTGTIGNGHHWRAARNCWDFPVLARHRWGVYLYIYLYTYTYIYTYIHIHIYIHMRIHMYWR